MTLAHGRRVENIMKWVFQIPNSRESEKCYI